MGRLLQAERLRHGKGEATAASVNLHALATGVAGQHTRNAEQKGLQIAVEVPPDAEVNTDAELVRLALQNLIANSVTYSSRGTVRVGAHRVEGGGWSLWVSDEGAGIAPEHLGRIFEAFQRARMHGQQGVGLGLAIASRAAKPLNAELTVESKLGVGSTFRLTFPPEVKGG